MWFNNDVLTAKDCDLRIRTNVESSSYPIIPWTKGDVVGSFRGLFKVDINPGNIGLEGLRQVIKPRHQAIQSTVQHLYNSRLV